MSQGKGSNPRPLTVSQDEYARRWALAFGSEEALDEAVANADQHYALKLKAHEAERGAFEVVRVPLGTNKKDLDDLMQKHGEAPSPPTSVSSQAVDVVSALVDTAIVYHVVTHDYDDNTDDTTDDDWDDE